MSVERTNFADVLRLRPKGQKLKHLVISYLKEVTRSFEYTHSILNSLEAQARGEVMRLGGNPKLEAILDKLAVQDEYWAILVVERYGCRSWPWCKWHFQAASRHIGKHFSSWLYITLHDGALVTTDIYGRLVGNFISEGLTIRWFVIYIAVCEINGNRKVFAFCDGKGLWVWVGDRVTTSTHLLHKMIRGCALPLLIKERGEHSIMSFSFASSWQCW